MMKQQAFDQADLNNLIDNTHSLSDVLSIKMSHTSADVRKSVVFCLVEINAVINDDD
jgi:hypothetical protein